MPCNNTKQCVLSNSRNISKMIFAETKLGSEILSSIKWRDEIELQDFVVKNSKEIFSKFLEDVKICIIGREINNENGRVDILLLDQNGLVYIVEVKLDSWSSGKRHIFAQLFGYMSAISNQCKFQGFDRFIKNCEESIKDNFEFNGTFDQYLEQEFEISQDQVKKIKTDLEINIKENTIYGVIVMDTLEDSLKRDIDHWLTTEIRVSGIELQRYSKNDTIFTTLNHYGAEKLYLNKKHSSKWDNEHIKGWEYFENEIRENQELNENAKNILQLVDTLKQIPESEGYMKKSSKTLVTYFKRFGNWGETPLKIYPNGELRLHWKSVFKDDVKISEEFKRDFFKIDPIFEQEFEYNKTVYGIKPDKWIPKIDEFIKLFRKYFS